MAFDIVGWLSAINLETLIVDIVQFVLLIFAMKRNKNGTSTVQDLEALAEYHEKAAKRIREEIKNKE